MSYARRNRQSLKTYGGGASAFQRQRALRGSKPRVGSSFGGPGYARRSGYYGRFNAIGRRAANTAPEKKFHDGSISQTDFQSAGLIEDSILHIPQGTDENERIGRKITLTDIHMKFTINKKSTTDAANALDWVRVLVYWDKQTNGATASVTDILEASNFASFNNIANKGRFKTLLDKKLSLACPTGAYNGSTTYYAPQPRYFEFHKRLSIPIEYSSTAGAITELKTNNIGILFINENNLLSDFEVKYRVRYLDQ